MSFDSFPKSFKRNISHGVARINCTIRRHYLQLGESKTTTGADAAVVLNGRASHNRTQLVSRTGSERSGLRETGLTTAVLLAGLLSRKKNLIVSSTKIITIPTA